MSDDQQDITRGKGFVDSLFQAPMDSGTHIPVMSSHEYISQGLHHLDNTMDGLYIAPAFMDKLVVHITKNFMNLPNIKVLPLLFILLHGLMWLMSIYAANLSDGIKLNRKLGLVDGSPYGFVLDIEGPAYVKDETTDLLLVPRLKKMPIK